MVGCGVEWLCGGMGWLSQTGKEGELQGIREYEGTHPLSAFPMRHVWPHLALGIISYLFLFIAYWGGLCPVGIALPSPSTSLRSLLPRDWNL